MVLPRKLRHQKHLLFNRELSWVEFNRRVLEEAFDQRHPLLERLKFLGIFSSNLDEFFMVRVSGLQEALEAGFTETSPDGMTPSEQLKEISKHLRPLIDMQTRCLEDEILPALEAEDTDATSCGSRSSFSLRVQSQSEPLPHGGPAGNGERFRVASS